MKIVKQNGTYHGKQKELIEKGILTHKNKNDFKIGDKVLVTRKFFDAYTDEVKRGIYTVIEESESETYNAIYIEDAVGSEYEVADANFLFVEKYVEEKEDAKEDVKEELLAYNAGHVLNFAMVDYRNKQAEEINSITGIKCYNVLDDKSINDKANAVQEGLAERIVANDFKAMQKADIFVFDILNEGLGTIAELGIVLGMKHEAQKTVDAHRDLAEDKGISFEEWIKLYDNAKEAYETLHKPVLCYCSDIRQGHGKPYTDPDRAEFSTNQFVYGMVLELTDGKGFISWEEVKKELARLGERNV